MKWLSTLFLLLFCVVHLDAQIGTAKDPLYCADAELLNDALTNNPYAAGKIRDQNDVIRTAINNYNPLGGFTATIPVVVHILIDPSNSATNISDQQVIDQIAALNNEFNVVNSTNIYFCLAQNLPDQTTNWTPYNGTGTAGITRTTDADISNHNSFYEMGLLNSVAVGFDPQRYLNIWVVGSLSTNTTLNVLAYAPYPIIPTSILDGVVIRYDVFGDNTSCSCYTLFGNYQQGKVLVHEVGHYLGVYHPFQRGIFDSDPPCQNTTCNGVDGDLCCDTPPCWNTTSGWNGATFGCPGSNMNSCTSTNCDDNYMEYTDDPCKSVFTNDQLVEMINTILTLRAKLISPENLVYTGLGPQCGTVTAALVPDFYVPETQVCTGGTLDYIPVNSNNTATSYAWTFPGGSPSTSTSSSSVTVTYSTPGVYSSTLTVTDGSNTASFSQTVYVSDCSVNDATQSNWYFGDHASLLFTASALPTSPVAPPSAMFTREGAVSISNSSGTALFYTNSQEVYEATGHTQMSGGTMNGSPNTTTIPNKGSASQGAVSFPDPANSNQYYAFTVSDIGATQNQLSYSIINISSNTITSLNVAVGSSGEEASEHLAAIPDCNGSGFWVITHGINSPYNDNLLAYHVTSSGVNNTPVVSNSYTITTANSAQAIGQIDVSQDGSRMVVTSNSGVCQLYDFDKQTGSCTLVTTLPNGASMYSACFSPDGKLLYTLAAGNSGYELLQWELSPWHCSTNFTSFLVADMGNYSYNNTLQLGPDNRIYITSSGDNKLSVINFPNQLGSACGFNYGGQHMVQQTPFLGLPNMVDAKVNPTPEISFCPAGCNAYTFYTNGCGSTYAWDFGDGGTSSSVTPTYTYTATGTYTVSLTIDANIVTPIVVNATGAPAVFAIDVNGSSQQELVRLDPVTGSVQQVVTVFPFNVGVVNGSSTFDPNHNKFMFVGTVITPVAGLYHIVIDVTNGNYTYNLLPPSTSNSEYEYNPVLNKLYGMVSVSSTKRLCEIDPLTGITITPIITITSGISIVTASSTLDYESGNNVYMFKGNPGTGLTHYRININSPGLSATSASNVATEYKFDNPNTTNLYALGVFSSSFSVVQLNPSNGSATSQISNLSTYAFNTNLGCTTYDPDAVGYIFYGPAISTFIPTHFYIDCGTGAVTATAYSGYRAEYQYASCAPTCLSCRYANPNPPQAQQPASAEFVSSQPNPSDQQTTFNYHVVADGQVTLEIYDVSGKLVARPVVGVNQVAGDYQLQWDSSQLQSGIYYCRLTTASGQSNSKMVIAR